VTFRGRPRAFRPAAFPHIDPRSTMKKHITIAAAAALALLAGAADAAAQDQWTQQVRGQLTAASEMIESEGFASTHEVVTGGLAEGATEQVEIELEAGVEYVIVGVCDVDCSDLDLFLRDPSGRIVDSDIELDDVPIVTVTPERTGTYTLEVRMVTCSAAPCRYGVGTYGR
jgi:hypothetical protein